MVVVVMVVVAVVVVHKIDAVGLRVWHGMVVVSGGVAIVACSSDRVYILTWSCLRGCCGRGGGGRRSYSDIGEICLALRCGWMCGCVGGLVGQSVGGWGCRRTAEYMGRRIGGHY